MPQGIPSREIFWNISSIGHWIIYVLLVGALACCVWFFVKRRNLWRLGSPENRSDHPMRRLLDAAAQTVSQRRVVHDPLGGFMHLLIFWGMVVLIAATAVVAANQDLHLDIAQGDVYLYLLSLAADVAGIAVICGIFIALVRRFGRRDKGLETVPEDIVVDIFLLTICMTGFFVEGLRIAGTSDPWRAWSPVGNAVAGWFETMDSGTLMAVHGGLWWFHMLLAFVFMAYFIYSKLAHVLLIPGNYFFRNRGAVSAMPFIDMEDENLETMGVGKVEEFTWKDLYDTEACIRCGRCQDNCPAHISGKDLSPKDVLQNLRARLIADSPALQLLRAADPEGSGAADAASAPADTPSAPLVGSVVSRSGLWACTTCGECLQVCPAMNEQPIKLLKMRTYQVSMESDFPAEAQATFRNMEQNGNPWGIGWQNRTKWAADLPIPTLDEIEDIDYLYWPGCSGAYDSRNQKVSRAVVKLLQSAGVRIALLGNDERCCGDAARRLGNEYLYYSLATENIANLQAHKVKKIVTQCPHCLNVLKHDYPQLGGCFEVVHHTELLASLIEQGRLKVDSKALADRCIVYHDSCYLGRYNDIYREPRDLLSAQGATLAEMKRSHADSFCCGAGGGRMWLEETEGTRINLMRTEQALETKADTIATACPFCLTMLADGSASHGDAALPVCDVAELLL